MKHFNTIRKFFDGDGHQSTQEWIRLQILRRQATPGPADGSDGLRATTTRLKEQNARFKFFYEAARFCKSCSRSWDSCFPGWRSGLAGFSILATLVLVANLAALLWTATHLDALSNYATVTVKNCKTVENTTAWIHLVINVLSVALLAGSNYCMQCLSSPTRAEVDAAHAKGSYLNIGILSLRNILSCRKGRIVLLLALGLSSVPLHAVYNNSVSIMYPNQHYDVVVVAPAFFSGVDYKLNTTDHTNYVTEQYKKMYYRRLSTLQGLTLDGQIRNSSRWTHLSIAECKVYGTVETYHGSVLLVTEEDFDWKGLVTEEPQPHDTGFAQRYDIGFPVYDYDPFKSTLLNPARRFLYLSQHISYCLSLQVPGHCSLQIHIWLLLTVVVCNMAKLACLILTFKEQSGIPLVTVGDAVASFLSSPCPSVKGMCLLSKDKLSTTLQDEEADGGCGRSTPIQYQPTSIRYYRSISFTRWTIYSSSCMVLMIISSYWWNRIRANYREKDFDVSLRALWNMGFGNLKAESSGQLAGAWCRLPTPRGSLQCGPDPFFLTIVPQLAISSMYIAMNHQITVMVQLRDWTRLALHPHPLRVSDPTPSSAQVSTYWLTLPYRYSLPLLGSSCLLDWLASQAFFQYRIVYYNDDGSLHDGAFNFYMLPPVPGAFYPYIVSGVGWSAMGVMLSILVVFCVFMSSLAFGTQTCAPGLPLGPTNSLAIAAACHPPEDDRNAAIKLVQWGEVQSDNNTEERDAVRHCTITSRKVKPPKAGRWYA